VRDGPRSVSIRVPSAASSVAVVRRDLRRWMRRRGAPAHRIDDARVVVSELVANSVRHARPMADGCILVAWSAHDADMVLSVTDGGAPTEPHRIDAPVSALSGRGMAIVDSLAVEWWLERAPARATVHTRLLLQ
jgi:serine/threonine-protein kinase RsbW